MNIDALNEIKKFLTETHEKFENIKFRYEFDETGSTYIIEVKPVDLFTENELYGEIEYNFTREFELKYPGYMIMFVSDNSLIKVVK
jgi:hypothetical protein